MLFFNDTATTEIYTLSLHDALPISRRTIQNVCAISLSKIFRHRAHDVLRDVRRIGELHFAGMIMEILRLEKKYYFGRSEIPPARLDTCVLDVFGKLRKDEIAVLRRRREGLRLLYGAVGGFVLCGQLQHDFPVQLFPKLEIGLGDHFAHPRLIAVGELER